MQRNIWVDIDSNTWPGPGLQPAFPTSFTPGPTTAVLRIPELLLMIGYLTTPISATGVSLSEFWAWVRYLAAISDQNQLSLTRSFWELDAHQKTILSDDFGMGVPIVWLHEKLSLVRVVDGRYFMQRIAASVGATQARTAKRGPNKTPDFVAQDENGMWHVIECKGTQSGSAFSLRQLGIKGPPAEGGVAQKLSIQFPAAYTGQRLVCGLSIDVEGGAGSVLKIVDPKPKKPLLLTEQQIILAQDAANRGVMARALRMAGFEITAESIASPFGSRPDVRRARLSRDEIVRRKMIEERDGRARNEISDIVSNGRLFEGDFRGRETVVALPRELIIDDQPVRRVVIRSSVNREAIEEIEQQPSIEVLAIEDGTMKWTNRINKTMLGGEGRAAKMQVGSLFRLEVELEA